MSPKEDSVVQCEHFLQKEDQLILDVDKGCLSEIRRNGEPIRDIPARFKEFFTKKTQLDSRTAQHRACEIAHLDGLRATFLKDRSYYDHDKFRNFTLFKIM